MYKLVIADDEGKNTVVPLVRDEITIGRKEGNTIRLTERNVSRRHARLVKANGRFVLEDLHSYNGVRVNGTRIGAETPLQPGDQIQIGDYQLALQVDQAEASTVPEAMSPVVADAETAMIAAPGPPARLVMITPPAPGAEFVLTHNRIRLGRAEDLDVWVNHRSISREHAEIQKEPDGGFRLIDLGSANGVRVNGNDVQNALLTAGDVVELGQVRFRFVGAGEHYAFDADRTVQMDAVSIDRRGSSSRAPLFAAIGIIGVAIVGAVAVALFWGTDDPQPTSHPIDSHPDPTNTPAPDYAQSLAQCRAGLAALHLTDAITAANAALTARPADADATACRAQALALQPQEAEFQQAQRQLSAQDYESAWVSCANIPEGSPFRVQPQCTSAAQQYANLQLEAGRQILTTSPEEAHNIADNVLLIPEITPTQRTFAESLKRAAEEALANASANVHPPPHPTPHPPPHPPPHPNENPTNNAHPDQNPPPNPPPDEHPPAANAEADARACTARGDNACVIRLLEGNARSEGAMAMLIEAYRARGQTAPAIRQMRVYVDRFPGTARSRNYAQIIAAHQE